MLRIALAAVLVAFVVAGCGSAARPHGSAARGVPRALAGEWAARASTIGEAAAAGNSCRALRLAGALRDDVIAAESKVPARLRSPLVTGVNALADRLVCTVPPQTVTVAPSDGKPGHKPPHGDHGAHGHHGHGGDQGNQS